MFQLSLGSIPECNGKNRNVPAIVGGGLQIIEGLAGIGFAIGHQNDGRYIAIGILTEYFVQAFDHRGVDVGATPCRQILYFLKQTSERVLLVTIDSLFVNDIVIEWQYDDLVVCRGLQEITLCLVLVQQQLHGLLYLVNSAIIVHTAREVKTEDSE